MLFNVLRIRIVLFLLYCALLTPLVFYRSFLHPLIVPKVFLFQALVEILFALWLPLALTSPRYRPRLNLISLSLFVFLGALFISAFTGIDLRRSLWSTGERSIGLIAFIHFFGFFLVLSLMGNALNWRRYFTFSFAVSVAAAVGAIVQLWIPQFFLETKVDRPGSFLGNPTFLAAYLLFHIFIGLFLASNVRRAGQRLLFFLGVLLEVTVVFLTQTRGALLGLSAGLVLLACIFAIRGGKQAHRAAISFLLFIFTAALLFVVTRHLSFWQRVPGLARFATVSSASLDLLPRILALNISWQSFLDRPLLGWGWENFKYPFDRHYDPRLLRSGFTETYFDKPHNVLLEYLVTGGAVGLIAYLGLFAAIFFLLFKKMRERDNSLLVSAAPFLSGAVAAYLVQNIFVFDTFGSYLMFFIVLAFLSRHAPRLSLRAVSHKMPQKAIQGEKDAFHEPPQNPFTSPWAQKGFTALFLGIALFMIYRINYRTLALNNHAYWGLNYFVNRMPEAGLARYAAALKFPHPYRDEVRRDFISVLSQVYGEGMPIPNVQNVAEKAMEELVLAIQNNPYDYYLRLVFADAATVFYELEPLSLIHI